MDRETIVRWAVLGLGTPLGLFCLFMAWWTA